MEMTKLFGRALAALVVVVVVVAGGTATASAHTLSKGYAASSIALEASDYFEWKYEDPDAFVTFPKVHKYECTHVTRHIVDCPGTFQVLDWSDTDFPMDQDCRFEARARYRSHNSYTARVKVINHECY